MTNEPLDKQIESLAQLQFTDAEIATIVDMPVADLLDQYQRQVDRGRLLAEATVRQSLLRQAKNGSTAAQKEFMLLNRLAKRTSRRRG